MAGSIQFRGKAAVIQAFESRDIDAWAIFQAKQFIHKGVGAEELESFLSMIENSGTNSCYTLKVFEDITDAKQIKEKTECDGSYNFVLTDHTVNGVYQNPNYGLSERLKAIEDKLDQRTADLEDEDEEETIGSVVMNVLKDPAKASQWIELIKGILSPGSPAAAHQMRQIPFTPQAQTMGNIPAANTEETLDRIEAALEILGRNDPKIADHLEKLAQISEKNKGQWTTLLLMLENM